MGAKTPAPFMRPSACPRLCSGFPLMTVDAIRDPANYRQVTRDYPHGAEWVRDVRSMVSDLVDSMDRTMSDDVSVALHVASENDREISGLIIWSRGRTSIVPMRVSRNLVFLSEQPLYAAHDGAVMMLVQAFAEEVDRVA